MMVDWLTVEVPDPVGLRINDGQIMRVDRDGAVQWEVDSRLSVQGSWSSNMTFRAVGAEYCVENRALTGLGNGRRKSGLEVSGNPAKFLTGHNLFGSDDPAALLRGVLRQAASSIFPCPVAALAVDAQADEAVISRIDLTASWMVERPNDVLPVLRAMEETVWCPYRGRGVFDAGGSTLYYGLTSKGKRAKDWMLKLYWKGAEVAAHPLPGPALTIPGLVDDLARTIRVELTLRKAELKRLGLTKLSDWSPAKVREIWEAYVARLNLEKTTVNLDTADLGALGLKARHAHAIAAWRAGNDLRSGMSRTAFYRLRREVLEASGHDIAALCPKSNVVQLRRLLTVQPAHRPNWAKQLSAALQEAA